MVFWQRPQLFFGATRNDTQPKRVHHVVDGNVRGLVDEPSTEALERDTGILQVPVKRFQTLSDTLCAGMRVGSVRRASQRL